MRSNPQPSKQQREVPDVATGFVLNICQKGCCLPSNTGKLQQIVRASPALSERLQPKASLRSHKPPFMVAMAGVGSSADITLCFSSSDFMLKDGGSRAGPCTTSTTASTPSLHHAVGLRGQRAEMASSPCHQGWGTPPGTAGTALAQGRTAGSEHTLVWVGQGNGPAGDDRKGWPPSPGC